MWVEEEAARNRVHVGDIVLYTSRGSADGRYPPMTVPLIVVHVSDIGSNYGPIIDGWAMNPRGQRYEEAVLGDPYEKPGTWKYRE